MVFGLDIGYPHYATALIGILLLIVPFAGIAFLVWLVVAGTAFLGRSLRRN